MDDLKLEEPEIKMAYINNNKPNSIIRASRGFVKKCILMNKQRKDNNLPGLRMPKITELIIRHKNWPKIQEDIMNYLLEEEEDY